MSFLGKNIKKIRLTKKLTQNDFANIFNLSRASIGAYEEERAEAKIETLINISEYFQISIDKLLKSKLTINDILHFSEKIEKIENSIQKKSISVVKFEQIEEFCKFNSNSDIYYEILIPFLDADCIGFEYFQKKTKEVQNVFDNCILICKKKIIFKDILFPEKLYLVLDGKYYLGTINIKNNYLQIRCFDDNEIDINIDKQVLLYEVVSVLIKDINNLFGLERYKFIKDFDTYLKKII